jgi:hypothetical protein
MLAAGGEVEVSSVVGTRTIPVADLVTGPFTNSLEAHEMVTGVRVPTPAGPTGGTYLKLERKVGDFATVGVAVQLTLADGRVERAGIALTAVGPTTISAPAAEQALVGAELTDEAIRQAARLAAEAAQPRSDIRGSADYKRRVVEVFTERGLRRAAEAAKREATAMAEQTCPNCGAPLPQEIGQHALAPSAGAVTCPTCGATVRLGKGGAAPQQASPPAAAGPVEGGQTVPPPRAGEETFSGRETLEGVMDEISKKEGGTQ